MTSLQSNGRIQLIAKNAVVTIVLLINVQNVKNKSGTIYVQMVNLDILAKHVNDNEGSPTINEK